MKINKLPFQQSSSNSTFKVSTSSLLRCLKKILNNAIETPPPFYLKKLNSSERVCRDLKDLFKPFISH